MKFPILSNLLFVPGHRPERFDKAWHSGADGVVLDLEDAVSVTDKDVARSQVFGWLASDGVRTRPEGAALLAVRINSRSGPYFEPDVQALCHALRQGAGPDVVVLPKVESATDIEACRTAWRVHAEVPPLIALVETAVGLEAVASIARAEGVVALGFGAADLAADLGCEMTWEALLYARSRVAHAAALGRVALLDVPHLVLADEPGLRQQTLRAKALGFTGKFAIHPSQVAPIRESFMPSADELARARAILAAAEAAQGTVCVVDGRMVDEPVVRSARQVVERMSGGRSAQEAGR